MRDPWRLATLQQHLSATFARLQATGPTPIVGPELRRAFSLAELCHLHSRLLTRSVTVKVYNNAFKARNTPTGVGKTPTSC